MRALVLFGIVLAGCIPFGPFGGGLVDYADFVRWNGIDYQASYAQVGRAITDADLGPEHFRVKVMLAGSNASPDRQIEDGDAAYVPAGQPVYAVRGYTPAFRLAARHDGRLVLYEARTSASARFGRDLLDIEGKVFAIGLLDEKTGTKVVARIAEPPRVAALVQLVLDGRVGAAAPPIATARTPVAPGWTTLPIRPASSFVSIVFELNDGTASVRGYDLASGSLTPNLAIAGTFREAIQGLIASAPTPTPTPPMVNLATRYGLAGAQSVTVKRPDRPFVGVVAAFAAALDAEMPAQRAAWRPSSEIVLVFAFPDRTVSLAYEPGSDTLTVVVPDDEMSVRATPALRALIDR